MAGLPPRQIGTAEHNSDVLAIENTAQAIAGLWLSGNNGAVPQAKLLACLRRAGGQAGQVHPGNVFAPTDGVEIVVVSIDISLPFLSLIVIGNKIMRTGAEYSTAEVFGLLGVGKLTVTGKPPHRNREGIGFCSYATIVKFLI